MCSELRPMMGDTLTKEEQNTTYINTDPSLKKQGKPPVSFQSLSHVQLFGTPWQHARLPYPSLIPRVCSNSRPSSWWCHPTISSSIIPFSTHLQSFPASGSFPTSQFLSSGSQSIEVSVSASVLPMNIQDWFLLRFTGLISVLPK